MHLRRAGRGLKREGATGEASCAPRAGVPRLKVVFTVDADGTLSVSANEKSTGVQASIKVEPSYGLSDDEFEAMLEVAIDKAEEDFEERLLIEARVEAEGVAHALSKALETDVSAPFAQRRIERDLPHALEGRSAAEVGEALGVE